ncbi:MULTISPECIES: zf-TFIIB domain-containing protein [Marinobacter]|jgi:hypothetical protein|uniref:TFIIB-type zinc ribbon-containing protein n=1 Tax=Marinobacter TaxID=2742 RepID=UPI000EC81F4F|nr:zf-TFIIB domain-containing protein [Marinobacter sp. UBA5687]HCL38309.1 hypothetical protein [Marinobacter nauticus]|tara:strand:- start:92 stop:349 length:258 start_codon:yes stop_codon:yes gene_type:complete
MKCPVCNETNLVMSERQGIEIDYCPQCRGVWLDRGELDKIIERSATAAPAQAPQPTPNYSQGHHGHYEKPHKYHKRKSFLSELFD